MFIQSLYSFQIIVPVVQRIERRFPNAKAAFLQELADVISSEQMTVFKRVDKLLSSSYVITNLPIFIHPGDTTGGTNFSTVSVSFS
jgi:hypothetical protein